MKKTTSKAATTKQKSETNRRKPEPFIGDIQFRSPHNNFPLEARDYLETKLRRLTRFFNTLLSIHVTHEEQRGLHQVTINLDADGRLLHLAECHHELRAAIDALIDRLEHQIVRYKDRLKKGNTRIRREALRGQETATLAEDETEGPRLTEVRRLALKPMSLDEAILQVELANHGFLVFRDTETDQLCVIQRLSDGNYGLMEISG